MRFNSNSDFNVSVGTDSYSPKILEQIINFHNILNGIELWNKNVFDIDFDKIIKEENVFCYIDPPYTNSLAVYNESKVFGGWKIEDDLKLFEILDKLANNNVNFGLSNVFVNRDKENTHLIDWCNKNKDRYYVYHTNKNYNPFSRGNSESDEVYITNYKNNSMLF